MTLSVALHSVCIDSFYCKLALFIKVHFRKRFKNVVRGLVKVKAYY